MRFVISQTVCEWLFFLAKILSKVFGKGIVVHIPYGHAYSVFMNTNNGTVSVSTGKNAFPANRQFALRALGKPPIYLEDDVWMDLYTIKKYSNLPEYLSWVNKTIEEFDKLSSFLSHVPLAGKLVSDIHGIKSCIQFRRTAVLNCVSKREGYQLAVGPLPNFVCEV